MHQMFRKLEYRQDQDQKQYVRAQPFRRWGGGGGGGGGHYSLHAG